MGVKINATNIAKPFRDDIKKQIEELKKSGLGKKKKKT